MIREITRPSTALCTLPMFIGFLLGEPKHGSCCRLAEVVSAAAIILLQPYLDKTLTITADNGKEFAGHETIKKQLTGEPVAGKLHIRFGGRGR
jgi:hypothetical protein